MEFWSILTFEYDWSSTASIFFIWKILGQYKFLWLKHDCVYCVIWWPHLSLCVLVDTYKHIKQQIWWLRNINTRVSMINMIYAQFRSLGTLCTALLPTSIEYFQFRHICVEAYSLNYVFLFRLSYVLMTLK